MNDKLKVWLHAGDKITHAAPYPRHVRIDEWNPWGVPVVMPNGYVVSDDVIPDAPRSYELEQPLTMERDGLVTVVFDEQAGTARVDKVEYSVTRSA